MYWPDLPRVSGAGFILSANVTHALKLINLIMNRDLFVSLIDFFVESLSKRNLKDIKVYNILLKFEMMAFRVIVMILGGAIFAVIGLVGVGDLVDSSGLPLVSYYPFDIHYSPVFQLVYLHQMLATFTAASFNVTLDMFTNSLVIQLCCQFELLKRDIELIQQIPATENGEISRRLEEIIERQCILKTRCVQLSRAYGNSMLGQFLGSIFIMCISFYQFYQATDASIITLISIMCTMMGALLQAFFYCYYGNEIKVEVSLCFFFKTIILILSDFRVSPCRWR